MSTQSRGHATPAVALTTTSASHATDRFRRERVRHTSRNRPRRYPPHSASQVNGRATSSAPKRSCCHQSSSQVTRTGASPAVEVVRRDQVSLTADGFFQGVGRRCQHRAPQAIISSGGSPNPS